MRTPALLLPPLLLAALLSLSLPAPAAAQEGLTPELAYKIEELSEQHIVEMDSEKIVVEVSGISLSAPALTGCAPLSTSKTRRFWRLKSWSDQT